MGCLYKYIAWGESVTLAYNTVIPYQPVSTVLQCMSAYHHKKTPIVYLVDSAILGTFLMRMTMVTPSFGRRVPFDVI